jgi:hypothetical protein
LSEQELDSFIAAGFTKEHVLEVIVIVAASTITNYAGTITNPPLEDPFRQHAWRGQHGCSSVGKMKMPAKRFARRASRETC